MAFESIKAEIDLLLEAMVNQPQDEAELQEQLRAKLGEMRAMGLPLPADMVELERRLDEGLTGSKGPFESETTDESES
jgi:hypothetical protein